MAKAQGPGPLADLVVQCLDLYSKMSQIVLLSNSKMADNILSGSGNYSIPIGNSHTEELAKEIMRKWHAMNNTSTSSYVTPTNTYNQTVGNPSGSQQ